MFWKVEQKTLAWKKKNNYFFEIPHNIQEYRKSVEKRSDLSMSHRFVFRLINKPSHKHAARSLHEFHSACWLISLVSPDLGVDRWNHWIFGSNTRKIVISCASTLRSGLWCGYRIRSSVRANNITTMSNTIQWGEEHPRYGFQWAHKKSSWLIFLLERTLICVI